MNDIEAKERFKAIQKKFAKHKAEYIELTKEQVSKELGIQVGNKGKGLYNAVNNFFIKNDKNKEWKCECGNIVKEVALCGKCGKVQYKTTEILPGEKSKESNPIKAILEILDDLPDIVNGKAEKPKTKKVIKYKHKPYFCNKCERFHKYKFRGKLSKTHKAHFKHIYKYKDQYSQSELFKLNFRQKWKSEKNNPKNDENWKRKAKIHKCNMELTLSEIENLDGL